MAIFSNSDTSIGAEDSMAKSTPEKDNWSEEALEWDGEISSSDLNKGLLKEGNYEFTVESCEKSHYQGGLKLPSSPMAKLNLNVHTQDGDFKVKTTIILCRRLMRKIISFFMSVGQMNDTESFRMNWSNIVNANGYAHITVRKYTDSNGKEHSVNDVERYLTAEEFKASASTQFDPGENRNY